LLRFVHVLDEYLCCFPPAPLAVFGFELRTSHLLCRHATTQVTPSALSSAFMGWPS
jgi:hypothetical protein